MERGVQSADRKPAPRRVMASGFLAAFDADAEFFYASERGEFGDADAQPRRLEIPDHHVGNGFDGMLQQ